MSRPRARRASALIERPVVIAILSLHTSRDRRENRAAAAAFRTRPGGEVIAMP